MNDPSVQVHRRGTAMLRSALGPAVGAWLDDAQIAEVMLNADGRLWVDHLTAGMAATDERLTLLQAERIIRLVAHHVGAEVHAGCPRVSAELPGSGERFVPARARSGAHPGRRLAAMIPISPAELRELLLTLLTGATSKPRRQWERLVRGIDLHPLSTHPRCNWTVRVAGTAAEVDAIGRAATIVQQAHPYARAS